MLVMLVVFAMSMAPLFPTKDVEYGRSDKGAENDLALQLTDLRTRSAAASNVRVLNSRYPVGPLSRTVGRAIGSQLRAV